MVNSEWTSFLPEIFPVEVLPLGIKIGLIETAWREEKKVLVLKGCIIEISMLDKEEAQTEAKPAKQVAVSVTVNHDENVSTVWIICLVVDQLAEMEGQLTTLYIDYGESEQQSVESLMELPVQFRD